jgi:hypothetical protein
MYSGVQYRQAPWRLAADTHLDSPGISTRRSQLESSKTPPRKTRVGFSLFLRPPRRDELRKRESMERMLEGLSRVSVTSRSREGGLGDETAGSGTDIVGVLLGQCSQWPEPCRFLSQRVINAVHDKVNSWRDYQTAGVPGQHVFWPKPAGVVSRLSTTLPFARRQGLLGCSNFVGDRSVLG